MVHLGFIDFVLRHRGIVVCLRRVKIALGDQVSLLQFFVAVQGSLRVLHARFSFCDVGLRCEKIGTRLIDGGFEFVLIDLGDDLILLHLTVEIGEQFIDGSRDLAPDLDRNHSRETPRGGNHLCHIALLHFRRNIRRFFGALTPQPKAIPRPGQHENGKDDEQNAFSIHGASRKWRKTIAAISVVSRSFMRV